MPASSADAAAGALVLHRDVFTRTLYLVVGVFGWFLYSFGPSVPMLRVEEGTSGTIAGLHGTALAAGAFAAGAFGLPLIRRFGSRRVLVAAVAMVGTGALLLIVGRGLVFSLTAVLITGSGGILASNKAMAALSLHHGESGASAVSEATAMTSRGPPRTGGAGPPRGPRSPVATYLTYLVRPTLTIDKHADYPYSFHLEAFQFLPWRRQRKVALGMSREERLVHPCRSRLDVERLRRHGKAPTQRVAQRPRIRSTSVGFITESPVNTLER